MADTVYLTNDAITRKKWSKDLFRVVMRNIEFNYLVGKGANNVIEEKTDLGKGEGDQIKFDIFMPFTQEGIVGREAVEGNEEELVPEQFTMTVEELNMAAATGGKMEEQRMPYNLVNEAKTMLSQRWGEVLSSYIINALAGNTAHKVNGVDFAQAIPAMNTNRLMTPDDVATGSLTAANVTDLTFLDRVKQRAELAESTAYWKMRPLNINGKKFYRVILHNYVFDALRENMNMGQWGDLQRNAMKLKIPNVEFEYNGMLVTKSEYVPKVRTISGAQGIYANVLCGAQAACWAWGGAGESKSTILSFVPYTKDAKRFLYLRGGGIWGCKRVQFDIGGTAVDFGAIAMHSYGAPLNG